MTDEERERALCRGAPVEVWFPDPDEGRWGSPEYLAEVEEASAVCRRCPVQKSCYAEGEARNEHGVWGGVDLTPNPAAKRKRRRR